MDIELNHRRTINAVITTFSRVWPYIAIAALLGLHAVNYSAPQTHKTTTHAKRRALVRQMLGAICRLNYGTL